MIDPTKYGTASEVAEAVGKPRTTLISAAERGEIDSVNTHGGTLLIERRSGEPRARQRQRDSQKALCRLTRTAPRAAPAEVGGMRKRWRRIRRLFREHLASPTPDYPTPTIEFFKQIIRALFG